MYLGTEARLGKMLSYHEEWTAVLQSTGRERSVIIMHIEAQNQSIFFRLSPAGCLSILPL